MKRGASLVLLSLLAAPCLAERTSTLAQKEAQALVGLDYTLRLMGDCIAPHLSCSSAEGGRLRPAAKGEDDWWFSMAACRDRRVLTMERKAGQVDGRVTWRIADALLLPRHDLAQDPGRPDALRLFRNGDCDLNGRVDQPFFALVRWGRRDRIDAGSGVEQAWTFDFEQGRIVPLATRGIVCYRPSRW